MYENFFHLERPPFSTVPDPNCVHLVGQHADAVSGLVYGVMSRKGYLVLTGEAGLGKTTALGAMANLLGDGNVQLSMILNPILSAPEFIEMVLLNFGFEQIPASKAQRLRLLQEFLIRSDQEGKVSALIVDEAHKLSPDLLEEIRLLGNFEASDHKLLQIVLVGQDELDDRLNRPELWQLKQRMVVRMSLHRLEPGAVERYLRFRWNKAGGSNPMPFTSAAIAAVANWSLGIPRLINAICDNALLLAFSQTTNTVDLEHVKGACTELRLSMPTTRPRQGPTASTGTPPRAASPKMPTAPQGEQQYDGPQFWQYSGPSLLDKWRPLTETEEADRTTKKAAAPGREELAATVTAAEDVQEPEPVTASNGAGFGKPRSAPVTNLADTEDEDYQAVPYRRTTSEPIPAFTPAGIPPASSPEFTAFRQEKPKRILRPIVPVIGAVVLVGGGLFFLLGRKPSAPSQNLPNAVKARLGMEVKRQDKGLLEIQWNPQNPTVADAQTGKLLILEGDQPQRTFALDPGQLKTGHLSYPFSAGRAEFRLEVVDRSGATASDSVFAYASNAPVTPQSATQAPAPPRTPTPAPAQQAVASTPVTPPVAQAKPAIAPPPQQSPAATAAAPAQPNPVAQPKPAIAPPTQNSVAPPRASIAESPPAKAPEPPPAVASAANIPQTTPAPASAPSTPPAPRPAVTQPQPPQAAAPSPLVGSWDVSRTGTTGSSFRPASVTLTIAERNGQIEGTLTGSYQVPANANIKPDIALSFSGAANGAQRYSFTSRDGMRGTIELIRTARNPNVIEVVWVPEGQPFKFDDVFQRKQ